ncbi:MAG TPA: ABATE domain-containing protein [Mycobacteriales bacterium]
MSIETLTLVGGHPALDLVNTAERGAASGDHLATPADAVVWAGRVGIEPGTPDEAALRRLRALREAVHTVVLDRLGRPPAGVAGALELLDARAAAAATRSRLRPAGAGLRREVGTDPAHRAEDQLVVAAVDLLTGPDAGRIKRCPVEQGGCGWVFVDRSRNSSRTWCRMADCGTAVKARRLTERRRQARAQQ